MSLRVDTGTPSIPVSPTRTSAGRTGVQERLGQTAPESAAPEEVQAGDGDVDTELVAELQAAIAAGRFTVHPERIADAVLASAQEALDGDPA
ncbi:MAG TPA: flagellar biosynthesis anti-sigma factor FlgM [Nevskiaceae bacterium]|nr:flagellar biosynthesis anti-sigma factor FlgM [Nevskiaceae bacterium]